MFPFRYIHAARILAGFFVPHRKGDLTVITFKTRNDLTKLSPDHSARVTVGDLVHRLFHLDHDGEREVYVGLIEE